MSLQIIKLPEAALREYAEFPLPKTGWLIQNRSSGFYYSYRIKGLQRRTKNIWESACLEID